MSDTFQPIKYNILIWQLCFSVSALAPANDSQPINEGKAIYNYYMHHTHLSARV